MSLEEKTAALGEKVRRRQVAVVEAIDRHLPELPLALLRETFDAKISFLRSPDINYGADPGPGIPPSEPWIIPKPPKGDYPAVVGFPMTPEKRRFLARQRLQRTRPASKIKP